MTMRGSSYPRRQQYRRLRRAIVSAAISATAGGLAVAAAGAGATAAAGALVLLMGGFLIDARRWLHLAARSRVGARSEDAVRRALSGLEAEGWRVRHSLEWGGRGDIDSVAIAPTGIGFAIVF
ncbi:MAG: nuclease-related domain-containing protein [Solirubrobacteraceae bacterium]